MAAVGLGLLVRPRSGAEDAFFLCTRDPDADLQRLFRAAGTDPAAYTVTTHPAAAYRQDLTVLRDGVLKDPAGDELMPSALGRFAHELRGRAGTARYLLAVEPVRSSPLSGIVIEQNGLVQAVVDPNKTYRCIDVAGPAGITTFRLEKGWLSVVEASCRHRNCQHVGAVAHGRIICVPNRLVATLPRKPVRYDVLAG